MADLIEKHNAIAQFRQFCNDYKYVLLSSNDIRVLENMLNRCVDHTVESGAVKDFYSREEALKFTKEDSDKNPELFNAVCNSMPKW